MADFGPTFGVILEMPGRGWAERRCKGHGIVTFFDCPFKDNVECCFGVWRCVRDRHSGSHEEAGAWFERLTELEGSTVSPGGVGMVCPVSRAAVHKRLKEGRMTLFLFQKRKPHKPGREPRKTRNTRKTRALPNDHHRPAE